VKDVKRKKEKVENMFCRKIHIFSGLKNEICARIDSKLCEWKSIGMRKTNLQNYRLSKKSVRGVSISAKVKMYNSVLKVNQ
jgi:hypothetical protein